MEATASNAIQRIAPSGLMRPDQVAEYLQITPSTLAVWRCTNRRVLPYVKIGGQVRYRRTDVDAFIDANLRNAPEAA